MPWPTSPSRPATTGVTTGCTLAVSLDGLNWTPRVFYTWQTSTIDANSWSATNQRLYTQPLNSKHCGITPITATEMANPYQDQQWKMVPGLADSAGVSFQSVNFPTMYLRHSTSCCASTRSPAVRRRPASRTPPSGSATSGSRPARASQQLPRLALPHRCPLSPPNTTRSRRTRRPSASYAHRRLIPARHRDAPAGGSGAGAMPCATLYRPPRAYGSMRRRDVAQLGSALDWGSRGRGFKSRRPDQNGQVRAGFLKIRKPALDHLTVI
jgi:hypothetical protein